MSKRIAVLPTGDWSEIGPEDTTVEVYDLTDEQYTLLLSGEEELAPDDYMEVPVAIGQRLTEPKSKKERR